MVDKKVEHVKWRDNRHAQIQFGPSSHVVDDPGCGPNVLELADSLGLSAEQQESVRAVFDKMAERAMQLGNEIVRLERVLDEAFAERRANKDSLVAVTSHIAALAGELRATHLAAHLELDGLLTEHQVMVYQRVRGYEHGGHVH